MFYIVQSNRVYECLIEFNKTDIKIDLETFSLFSQNESMLIFEKLFVQSTIVFETSLFSQTEFVIALGTFSLFSQTESMTFSLSNYSILHLLRFTVLSNMSGHRVEPLTFLSCVIL